MSNAARLAVIAAVAVIAAIAFVALRPAGEEPSDPGAEPAARSTPTGAESRTETRPRRARRRPEYARIQIRDGVPVGGARRIEVESGDTARIEVASDAPGEIHLHGYDLEARVAPEQAARLRFRADIEGIFELELHGTGAKLAELRVAP